MKPYNMKIAHLATAFLCVLACVDKVNASNRVQIRQSNVEEEVGGDFKSDRNLHSINGYHFKFDNIFPLKGIDWPFLGGKYTPKEMVKNCGGYYKNAKANLFIAPKDGGKKTMVKINVFNAPPYTVMTAWLGLAPPRSPLKENFIGTTALAPSHEVYRLSKITPSVWMSETAKGIGLTGTYKTDGTPGTGVASYSANSFKTDGYGNGHTTIYLDYPIFNGAFPYSKVDRTLENVAIGKSPFTIRLASHCADNKVYGLAPGFHEMFFNWSYDPKPYKYSY